MPCYVTQTVSVKLTMSSKKRIKEALNLLSMRIYKETETMFETFALRFDFASGKIEYDPDRASEVNEVKRTYSYLAIKEVAKKKKWAFKNVVQEPKTISLQLKKF